MGDRSNIVIEDNYQRIYLYSHWSGELILKSAVVGLESGRRSDLSYLARIVFADMIKDDMGQETGFGISPFITDNEHPLFVIGQDAVWFEDAGGEVLTDKISSTIFLLILDSIEDWKNRASSNELYDLLISKMYV